MKSEMSSTNLKNKVIAIVKGYTIILKSDFSNKLQTAEIIPIVKAFSHIVAHCFHAIPP